MAPRHPEHRHAPVQNSAVFVPGSSQFTAVPPPSPPSPSNCPASLCDSFDDLDLDRTNTARRPPARRSSRALEDYQRQHEHDHKQQQQHRHQAALEKRLHGALHVLNTEATALRCLARLYETDCFARDGLSRTVDAVTRHARQSDGERGGAGKLVVTGVGKSGLIGKKLVATFNSLGIPSVFLHPTEALHGDLGVITRHDTLLFVTFSGKTQELLSLLPHVDPSLPLVLLTSHTRPAGCADFMRLRPDTILLPAPVHEDETRAFGVPAPTTSTTVALAVGDAVAVTAAREIHAARLAREFARHHPGGAIGAAFRRPSAAREIAVPLRDLPFLEPRRGQCAGQLTGADVLRAGYASRTGWVRMGGGDSSGQVRVASPGRIRALSNDQLAARVGDLPGLFVVREDMLSLCGNTNLRMAVDFVVSNMQSGAGVVAGAGNAGEEEGVVDEGTVLAVLDKGEIMGVLEVGELLNWKDP